MKKYIATTLLAILILTNITYSYTSEEVKSADFLAYIWVIVSRENESDYELDNKITRREMLKVMMNMSWTEIIEKCEWKFSDMTASDWWCKYAEIALENGMIAANSSFRPDDNISKIEALKMIFKWINLEREENTDWKVWYVNTAVDSWIIDSAFTDYDTLAKRWWIFNSAREAIIFTDASLIEILEFLNL